MDILGSAAITFNINPEIHLGPLTLAWHGLTIAVGVLVAGALAVRYVREIGLDKEKVVNAALIMGIAGFIGSRAFYLLVNTPDALLRPTDWFGTRGFAIYGAVILGPLATAIYMRREQLSARYLDALAAGFPLGLAVGRLGDVINGEHHGPPTDLPWGIMRTNPGADVPSTAVAYHDGGLYEVALGLVIFAIVWPLRNHFRRPLSLLWTVIALYGVGRFLMFFYRSDSAAVVVGLNEAQLVSAGLVVVALLGLLWGRVRGAAEPPGSPG